MRGVDSVKAGGWAQTGAQPESHTEAQAMSYNSQLILRTSAITPVQPVSNARRQTGEGPNESKENGRRVFAGREPVCLSR